LLFLGTVFIGGWAVCVLFVYRAFVLVAGDRRVRVGPPTSRVLTVSHRGWRSPH